MELIRKEELKTAIMNFSEVMLTNAEVIKIIDTQDVIKIDEGYIEELERKVNESRPKGKWMWTSTFPRRVQCLNCGFSYESCVDYNYCPTCGAEMRGEE